MQRPVLLGFFVLVSALKTISVLSPLVAKAQEAQSPVEDRRRRPGSCFLASNPQEPGAECDQGVSVGTGLDRFQSRSSYGVGAAASDRSAVFLLEISRTTRHASFRASILSGWQLPLRIEAQATVVPINLLFTSIGRDPHGATFFNLQAAPVVRGRFAINQHSLPLGPSYFLASGEVIAHFLRLSSFADYPSGPSRISYASLRISAGGAAGVSGGEMIDSSSDSRVDLGAVPLAGVLVKAEGRLVINLQSRFQLEFASSYLHFFNLLNFPNPLLQQNQWQATGSVGALFGPGTSPNLFLRILGQADRLSESGVNPNFQPAFYLGSMGGVNF